jgi:hypothetical protein
VLATLERSPRTDAPGVPFIVAASTFLNDPDATRIEGVVVEAYLAPANATSLANCSAPARAALEKQRCRVASGAPAVGADGTPACQLEIPCQADLLLRACAVEFANGTAIRGGFAGAPPCSETPIGRNTTAWARSPWAVQPFLGLLPDRYNYTLGSRLILSFALPAYAGATSGLLVWGGKGGQRRLALPRLAPGANRVEIGPLGPECAGGCKAALLVNAGGGRTAGSPGPALPAVPTSKVFDPLGPATYSDSVELNVLDDAALEVTVAVSGAEGLTTRQGDAVVAPMTKGRMSVAVRAAGGGAPEPNAQVWGWGQDGAGGWVG